MSFLTNPIPITYDTVGRIPVDLLQINSLNINNKNGQILHNLFTVSSFALFPPFFSIFVASH